MDLFKDLFNSGIYNCDKELQKAIARYCFGSLIQSELDICREQWNSHYIRKSESSKVHGRPDHLYLFPTGNFTDNGFKNVQEDVTVISDYIDEYNFDSDEDDSIFIDYCDYVFDKLNLPECTDFSIATTNFLRSLEVSEE